MMKPINNIKEIQKLELDILKEFHEFCIKHDLVYSLMGGTMLGAVRHEGFIPWDDDIDVSMPRPDYDKFIDLTRNNLSNIYEVYSVETRKDYIHPFAKIVDNRTVLFEKNVRDKYRM